MVNFLIIASIIIILCVLFNKLSVRFGVPALLLFILLGMIFGSDGLFKIPFENFQMAEHICSAALIFIMFYGGFGTNWKEAKPVAAKAIALSTLGVFMTAALVSIFCHFVLKISFLESMLIGSVISSTDAASVFSILRSKKLNLKYNSASLLEVESGSNDPCSYMLTVIVLSAMNGGTSPAAIAYAVFAQFVYGIAAGVVIAFLAYYALKYFKFGSQGFDAAFVVAVAILSYAVPNFIGGNGYLSAYIVGIILGNADIKNKQSLIHFFDGITGIMQMILFFLLGLLSFPSQFSAVLVPSVAIAVFLTFIARPAAVFLILLSRRCKLNNIAFVSFAGLRGAASIVFAVMATINEAYTKNDVFHIVLIIVLLSISFQGTLLPLMAKKLNMIDNNSDVLKTFNDYTSETDVQFIQVLIKPKHPWNGKMLKDIVFPPDTLLVMLVRNKETIIPNGDTVLMENDTAILSALSFDTDRTFNLVELRVDNDSEFAGKTISEISTDPHQIVVLIKRGDKTVIPKGQTFIKEDDVLVMNKSFI